MMNDYHKQYSSGKWMEDDGWKKVKKIKDYDDKRAARGKPLEQRLNGEGKLDHK